MEDVQGWWEVPTVALFFNAFHETFNLIYIEILDLETALLNLQDPEVGISLDQLILSVLQGCFKGNVVNVDNWEEHLRKFLEEECAEEDNPIKSDSLLHAPPREKIQVLMQLCQLRLDLEGVMEEIKDVPSEDMQAMCVGKDNRDNMYWYFCDERLYKEMPSKSKKDSGPKKSSKKGKIKKSTFVVDDNTWSIACHTLSDWESLANEFSKSRHQVEKSLASKIRKTYLPKLEAVAVEKEKQLRKRLLEYAPKRTSSRISKVRAKRELERQMETEAREEQRKRQQAEQQRREAERKVRMVEDRRRRAEEREKIVEERSLRVQQRNMARLARLNNISTPRMTKLASTLGFGASPSTSDTNMDSSSEEDEDHDDDNSEDNSTCEADDKAVEFEDEDKVDEFEEQRSLMQKLGCFVRVPVAQQRSNLNVEKPVSPQSTFDKWKSSIDARSKLQVFRYPSTNMSEAKKLKPDNSVAPSNAASFKDFKSTFYKKTSQPIQHNNVISYRTTVSPSVVRLNFVKPLPSHQFQNVNSSV